MAFSVDQLLIFAARAGNCTLIEERLRLGADPNYYDAEHGSAAAQAVARNDIPTLTLLLQAGLCPNDSLAADSGLMEHALRSESREAAVLLVEHGFWLLPHSRSIREDRLQQILIENNEQQDASPKH